jgi:hypothetical protein
MYQTSETSKGPPLMHKWKIPNATISQIDEIWSCVVMCTTSSLEISFDDRWLDEVTNDRQYP